MSAHLLRFGDASFDITEARIDREPLVELRARYFSILRAFVADTYRACSFLRDRLERAGFKDGVVESPEHFARIPFLGPGEVGAVPDVTLLPDRYLERSGLAALADDERLARKFLTTSSTGKPKGAYYTRSDWQAATNFGERMTCEVPLAKLSRLMNCFHAGHVAGKLMEDIFTRAGCFVENNHHTNTTTQAIVHQLGASMTALGGFNAIALPPWRPPELAGNKGATLDMLLNEDLDNVIGRQVETLVTGGAPFPPDSRLKERTWEANSLAGKPKTQFVHTYGSAEVGIAASSCQADGESLHLIQGFIFTEIINEQTGEHAKNGETGLVAFTGLKHGSRFLRYIVGDEATYFDTPCACGRTSPRLKNVQRVLEKERLTAGCAAGGY